MLQSPQPVRYGCSDVQRVTVNARGGTTDERASGDVRCRTDGWRWACRRRRSVTIALAAVAVVVGVGVGLWEAQLWVQSSGCPIPIHVVGGQWVECVPPTRQPEFAWWLCALLGAGAAALIAFAALAVDRWPAAASSN